MLRTRLSDLFMLPTIKIDSMYFFLKKGYEIENQKTDYVISDDQRSGKHKYTARPYENEKRRSRSASKKSKRNSSENRQKIVKSHTF